MNGPQNKSDARDSEPPNMKDDVGDFENHISKTKLAYKLYNKWNLIKGFLSKYSVKDF